MIEMSGHFSDAEYRFKLFSYFAMSFLSVAILVGLYIIIITKAGLENTTTTINNQEIVMQNQMILRGIIDDTQDQINEQEKLLMNRTLEIIEDNRNNNKKLDDNAKRLDKIIEYLEIIKMN